MLFWLSPRWKRRSLRVTPAAAVLRRLCRAATLVLRRARLANSWVSGRQLQLRNKQSLAELAGSATPEWRPRAGAGTV